MESLGGIIKRQAHAVALAEGQSRPLSNREIGRRSAEHNDGIEVHWTAIGRYMRGEVKASSHILRLLAMVLATDDHPPTALLKEMQEAAGLVVGVVGTEWRYPTEVFSLSTPQVLAVEHMIRLLAAANEGEPARDVSAPEGPPQSPA